MTSSAGNACYVLFAGKSLNSKELETWTSIFTMTGSGETF